MNQLESIADIKIATYLFHPKLINVTRKFKKELLSHYSGITLVSQLINVASNASDVVSPEEFLISLKELKLPAPVMNDLYNDFSKVKDIDDDLLERIKGIVKNIVADEYIKEKQLTVSDPVDYLNAMQSIDLEDLFSLNLNEDLIREVDFDKIDVSIVDEMMASAVSSFYSGYNQSSPFNGYLTSQLILVSGAPGSGKSLFLINEARWQIKEHHRKVIYFAIGDLNEADFLIRIAAQELKIPMSNIPYDLKNNLHSLIRAIPEIGELKLVFIKPGELSPKNFMSYLKEKKYLENYDTYIIDYDSNFLGDENLYKKGDEIYSELVKISSLPNKLVFVASQPKQFAFNSEEFGKDGIGESSRKIHIPDIIITIGKCPFSVNPVGTIFICKNRRGNVLRTKYFLDINGEFIQVNDNQYQTLKNATNRLTINCRNSLEATTIELKNEGTT